VTADVAVLDHLSESRVVIAAVASLIIAAAACGLRALSISGAIAAFCVGTIALGFGGPSVGAALIAFFVSGSLLSRIKSEAGRRADRRTGKGPTRDAAQVFANGGVAAGCALVSAIVPAGQAELWTAGAIGALAAAAADTWATEIGGLSTTPPRSLATWKRVSPGDSGGVTGLGTLAAFVGGGTIGIIGAAFAALHTATQSIFVAFACVGGLGSTIDSYLGAKLQGVWECDRCRETSESSAHACGSEARFVRGVRWLDNDGVNAIASGCGAAAAMALSAVAARIGPI
jgi:uncharacterized protein (TIGR00297 family)